MENKKTNLPYIGIAALAAILTLGAGVGFYFARSGAYQETFMPNTTINGRAVAGKNVEEVHAMIEEELLGYALKITDRTGAGEVITKEEIGLRTEFEGGLEQILSMQEPMMWIRSLWTETEYKIGTMLVYDEALLDARIKELSFMDPETMEAPKDAYLSEYQFDTNSYEIVPETGGTVAVEDTVRKVIGEALLNLQEEVDLDAAGCYTKAKICADDPELTKLASDLNHYAGASVTHRFGDQEEVLDGDTIHQWLTVDGNTVVMDESKVTEYVRALAKRYNTAYGKRPFLTSYGEVVTIPGGSYGWRMDEPAEAAAVLEAVKEGAVRTREPEWLQKGASHGEYDYGNTYVEINLTGQHLFFYKDGELIIESDFVSGNASRGWSTPAGIYPLTYKQRNATLRGEDYATPVSYWMPFNGNIGLHDANWRASFGGNIYKTNGSHGCVNLPPATAKTIYEHITKGDPVICYHLEGTEAKKTESKPAAQKPAATKPAETTAPVPETAPAGTTAATPETAPAGTTAAPAETAPTGAASVETAPAPTEAMNNGTLTPEAAGALTETRTAEDGPGSANTAGPDTSNRLVVQDQGQTGPTETIPVVSETRPAGVGPGSGPIGPGGAAQGPGGTASGPAQVGIVTGP